MQIRMAQATCSKILAYQMQVFTVDVDHLPKYGVCLIGANSENGRLGRLGTCVSLDYQIPKR